MREGKQNKVIKFRRMKKKIEGTVCEAKKNYTWTHNNSNNNGHEASPYTFS